MTITIPISPGELIDRVTILEIKVERLRHEERLRNVATELALLRGALETARLPGERISTLAADLGRVNRDLWEIEDSLRDCERRRDFGPAFITLARAVYHRNDERARLKRAINDICGSDLKEEKVYPMYCDARSAAG